VARKRRTDEPSTPEGRESVTAPPPLEPRWVGAVADLHRGAGNAAVARLAAAGQLSAALASGARAPFEHIARDPDPDPDIPPPTPEERTRAADELILACEMKAREHRINTAQVCLVEDVDGTPGTAEITHLPAPYVRRTLEARAAGDAALRTAFDAAVGRILGTGRRSEWVMRTRAYAEVPGVLRLLESQFIHDPNASSLDLLDPARARHYRQGVSWGHEDYPGGVTGANEGQAVRMASELSGIRPERRANSGADRALDQNDTQLPRMREFIRSQLVEVPDLAGYQLNRHAAEQFAAMRAAALADVDPATGQGVALEPSGGAGSFYRTPAATAASSAASGNAAAVAAGLSSHNLGLAVDLRMSFDGHRYQETTTRPMQNVVDMRQSPAHKWLFVRGARWGFYPYQNEPWHWEYNPPGFRDLLMNEYREWVAAQPAQAGRRGG
jgi:hypothetical protein